MIDQDADTSIALPHSSVETSEFYKHINQDILEPRRMKQLLVWCGTRALPEKPTGTAENVNAILAGQYRRSSSHLQADHFQHE